MGAKVRKSLDRPKLDPLAFPRPEKLIASYVIDQMLPCSIVEAESFRNLIKNVPASTNIPCRQTLKAIIDNMYIIMKENIKKALESAQYVCSTADLWSARKRY